MIINTSAHTLSFSHLTLIWPDGTPCFEDLSGAFSTGITGLIGDNGSGKSSLLKVFAGILAPTTGELLTPSSIGYLPQDLGLSRHSTVADLFGISDILCAIDQVESGEYSESLFEIIGDQWDIAERTISALASAGLSSANDDSDQTLLTRSLTQLSGGESVTAAVVALLHTNPDIVLLDEPTNNLDSAAKSRLIDLLQGLNCPAVVVSHDCDLLASVDQIAELYDGDLRYFSGNFEAYQAAVNAEHDVAERHLREAKAHEKQQKRERIEAETKIARAAQQGKKAVNNKRKSPLVLGLDKMSAQKSYAKTREGHQQQLDSAATARQDAESKIRDAQGIYLELPGTSLPSGKKVLELQKSENAQTSPSIPERIIVTGPERWRVTGPNGAGKSTLIQEIVGHRGRRQGT